MTCTSTCRKPNGRQAHCGATGCHQTFSGLTMFDHHRVGAVEERHCADPAARGMHLDAYGVWRENGTRPSYWDADSRSRREPQSDETPSRVSEYGSDDSVALETRSGGPWGEHPAHRTCIDVTNVRAGQMPGSEWICGPDCPQEATP